MRPTQKEIEEVFKEEQESFMAFQEAHTNTIAWTLAESAARHRLQIARENKSDIIHRTLMN